MREAHDLSVDGTRIRLRERTPPDADEAVLFVHGATYPGVVAFDLSVEAENDDDTSYSWLQATAETGRAAFAVDLRGYGDSERPPEMDAPADANAPVSRAETVVADVRASLSFIADRFDRVHLLGYSWGTLVCGRLLAADDAPTVASLTQFAPVFRKTETSIAGFDPGPEAPAYRTVTRDDVAKRWDEQLPSDADPATFRGVGSGDRDPVLDAFWSQLSATGQGENDGVRAPNGTLVDLRETVEQAPYDPAAISPPALVVRGSRDPTATREDALGLYDGLTGPSEYAEVSDGTHFLPLEARREALYDLVAGFHDRT